MVDVPLADEAAVEGAHRRERTVLILALDAGDLVGIHPRMSRQNALFFPFLENDFVRHIPIIPQSFKKVKRGGLFPKEGSQASSFTVNCQTKCNSF